MAYAREGGSSKSSGDQNKGLWKETKVSHQVVDSSSYRLFPEPRETHCNMAPNLNIHSTDRPQTHVMPQKQQEKQRSEVLALNLPKVSTKVQTQFPFQTMKLPFSLAEAEDINSNENYMPVSARGSSSCFSDAPASMQHGSEFTLVNDGRSQSSYLPSQALGRVEGSLEDFADIMAVQQAYLCALHDQDEITPINLLHQSPHAITNHYVPVIHRMLHSRESTNAVTQQPLRIFGSSQTQHSGEADINDSVSVPQSIRIISVKGQIAGLCTNPHASRLIQHALETATLEEIIMVYAEVIPYARMLTIDVFANYTVQKLLEHGPHLYKSKFICNLIGHVLPLSLHMHGCRVIQKAFEVADHDLKLQMANEFCGNVLKCARDQYANHVLQKCMECVPAQNIQFIFRSFCRKAKAVSTTRYGCHVIQKVLSYCSNPQIYRTLVSEITEAVVKLASDPFGNYVVQHVVEHGGPIERSMIMKKFDGRVLNMSYQKYASNVIEKCLTFGSLQDRQLIATEILTAGGGQHFDHLLDMMCHMYANFVIKKLVTAVDEEQQRVLVEVAHCNMDNIMRYPHGRHVLAHIQKVLTDKGMPSDIQGYAPDLAAEE